MQITAYVVEDGRFKPMEVAPDADFPAPAVWIDALDPTVEEATDLATRFGLRLEVDDSLRKFDTYGHVEIDDQQLTVLMRADRAESTFPTDMKSAKFGMLVGQGKLITVRTGSTPAIEQTAREIPGMKADSHPDTQVLVRILSRAMQTTSAHLDEAEAQVRRDANKLFGTSSMSRAELDLEKVLSELGPRQALMAEGRYGHRVVTRLVEILKSDSRVALSPETRAAVDGLASDVISLRDFATSVDDQLARLVDATMGYIGIRQNASARWFSIIATIFMPPTLLAAVWGMNFQNMPELDDKYGYMIALGLLFLSATVPLWVVRKRGWAGR
jgi:magnesium transporter